GVRRGVLRAAVAYEGRVKRTGDEGVGGEEVRRSSPPPGSTEDTCPRSPSAQHGIPFGRRPPRSRGRSPLATPGGEVQRTRRHVGQIPNTPRSTSRFTSESRSSNIPADHKLCR